MVPRSGHHNLFEEKKNDQNSKKWKKKSLWIFYGSDKTETKNGLVGPLDQASLNPFSFRPHPVPSLWRFWICVPVSFRPSNYPEFCIPISSLAYLWFVNKVIIKIIWKNEITLKYAGVSYLKGCRNVRFVKTKTDIDSSYILYMYNFD